jgi:hypothetical protein
MAGITDIGGIFYKLGLDTDKNSFETGIKLVDTVGNSLNKLIGTARNASVALLGISIATGQVESANFKTAAHLGMTTEALDKWKAAAKIAGVSADGLVSSMGDLSYTMNNIRLTGIEKYADSLADLKMSTKDLQDANGKWLGTEEAYIRIIEHAQKLYNETDDPQERLQIINALQKTIGSTGADFFIDITAHQGKSIRDFLIGAGDTVFTTTESNKNAADFATEINTIKTSVESISKLFGSEVSKKLVPYAKTINDFISSHKKEIVDGISKAAEGIGIVATETALILAKLLNWSTSEKGKQFKDGMADMFGGAFGAVVDFFTEIGNGTGYQWLMEDLPYRFEQFMGGAKDVVTSPFAKTQETKDGILRPDGTLTQVAPDDWVFAVRNVGDLARAFIPQGATAPAGTGEYTINQTFNISGSSDMPQVLRQQAYQGTQDALMLMQQSSNRLQLMSGTR